MTESELTNTSLAIHNLYIRFFEECLSKHSTLVTFYDYSLFSYLNNDFDKSVELLNKFINKAEAEGKLKDLSAEVYHELGAVCIEAMNYDKAIEYLTESLRKDPSNKQAYFDRAIAFFETGNFDDALIDYMSSEEGVNNSKSILSISADYSSGLNSGLSSGLGEAITEFIPSLLDSVHGVNQALWALSTQPQATAANFAQACSEMSACAIDYLKTVDQSEIDRLCDEVKKLYYNFDSLDERHKGELIGYTIGKYGPDIFAGGVILKGAKALRRLKHANRVCNLESLAISYSEKQSVKELALAQSLARKNYLKSAKIHMDKQNKHVPGKHNYVEGKSIFLHKDPQGLLEAHAGTGVPVRRRIPGAPDYREKVNFGEFIGYHINLNTGVKTPTTFGEIRYSKTGAHIVPVKPE